MEIIEEVEKKEEQQSSTTVAVVNPSSNRHLSIPVEIIEDIFSGLPVESILRSTAVSKACYSLISHPSFSKLQLTHATLAHRTALFISAYDSSTRKRHYFSAASHGGPLTLLLTVDRADGFNQILSPPSHLNGLVCFTSKTRYPTNLTPYFVNPSTRKFFKLPAIIPPAQYALSGHLYGYDESTSQHKILLMARQFMVFDMSTRSWRNIEAQPPVGLRGYLDGGVCLDSKVHIMLHDGTRKFDILAFDFVTETFSLISMPQDARPHIFPLGNVGVVRYRPFIVKISGCLGVVITDYKKSKIHIWLLQDYENGVWVKETITLPEPWNALAHKFPLSIDANMNDEIVFNITKVSENAMSVPVYNMKSKSFRSLEFTLNAQFLSSKPLRFYHIKSYLESMVPV